MRRQHLVCLLVGEGAGGLDVLVGEAVVLGRLLVGLLLEGLCKGGGNWSEKNSPTQLSFPYHSPKSRSAAW